MSARLHAGSRVRTRAKGWLAAAALLLPSLFASGEVRAQQPCPEPSGAGSVEVYCYDALGRLIEQRRNDSASATIDYDDAGNRVSRTETAGSPGVVIVFLGGKPVLIPVP